MKRQYELMVIVKSDFPDNKDAYMTLVSKLVSGATVKDLVVLGKKSLSYLINKKEDGMYILATIEGTVNVSLIEREVSLGTDVLRYMLTLKK